MIVENIYPDWHGKLTSLALESDVEIGTPSPTGRPWRVLEEGDIDTDEKRKAVRMFVRGNFDAGEYDDGNKEVVGEWLYV